MKFDLQRFAPLSGKSGRVLKQSGDPTAFTQEAMMNSGDNLRYQITNAAKKYFDPAAAVTVETSTNAGVDWAAVSTGFVIEYLGGYIVFETTRNPAHLFRVSGSYLTMADWGGFLNWKLDLNGDMLEVTTFESDGYKEFTPGLKDSSGSAEAFWKDGSNLALLGTAFIFILYVDYGTPKRRYECYGYMKKDSPEVPVDELVKESIDFQTTGRHIYYREG